MDEETRRRTMAQSLVDGGMSRDNARAAVDIAIQAADQALDRALDVIKLAPDAVSPTAMFLALQLLEGQAAATAKRLMVQIDELERAGIARVTKL